MTQSNVELWEYNIGSQAQPLNIVTEGVGGASGGGNQGVGGVSGESHHRVINHLHTVGSCFQQGRVFLYAKTWIFNFNITENPLN